MDKCIEKLTASDLSQFTGTNQYYKHWLGCVYTDGIKYLADKGGAYWLLDAIFSYNTKKFQIKYPFQIWELKVYEDKSAILFMKEDSNKPVKVKQEMTYTDFPLEEIKLYFIDGVLLLTNEY